jgi:hypothetical protein
MVETNTYFSWVVIILLDYRVYIWKGIEVTKELFNQVWKQTDVIYVISGIVAFISLFYLSQKMFFQLFIVGTFMFSTMTITYLFLYFHKEKQNKNHCRKGKQ